MPTKRRVDKGAAWQMFRLNCFDPVFGSLGQIHRGICCVQKTVPIEGLNLRGSASIGIAIWSMRPDMHRSLGIDALEMGLFQRRPQKGQLIFHSERGSQYARDDFRAVLDQHGVQPSMSCKGNCWDNAVTETLFGSLKVERLHGECFQTIRQGKDAVLVWIPWYNRQRMHSTLNYPRPVEFESHWGTEHSRAAV